MLRSFLVLCLAQVALRLRSVFLRHHRAVLAGHESAPVVRAADRARVVSVESFRSHLTLAG